MTKTATAQDVVARLIRQAEVLSADYGPVVEEAVRLAAEMPLDAERAERLWTRIMSTLLDGHQATDDLSRHRLGEAVRAEVDRIVESVERPEAEPRTELPLHGRYGVEPGPVTPVPTFNGAPIAMDQGYVNVDDLGLWMGNHRVDLHVREFRERNHRDPDGDELVALMHGTLHLPSLGKKDPFEIVSLAASIARKGVERPPIVTWDGEPKDGNRRIAAAKYVLLSPSFTPDQKERARWIKVWRAPRGTTPDQFEAIVVALNFEKDHKIEWPEYVKARLVVDRYRQLRGRGRFTSVQDTEIKRAVADQFAISHQAVTRYLRMVQWAEDFEAYHVEEQGKDPAAVRYKANDIFQWFYEIQAGKTGTKLTERLDQDDDLKRVVYDLMFDVLNSGALVRNLHKVVADEVAVRLLVQAHSEAAPGTDEAKKDALRLVTEAVAEAHKNAPTKRIGFEQWLQTAVDRLGSAPPDQWRSVDSDLLRELERVFRGAIGSVEGELVARDMMPPERT